MRVRITCKIKHALHTLELGSITAPGVRLQIGIVFDHFRFPPKSNLLKHT